MPIAIKFENISKQYRLGLVSTQTLSHDLNRWWKMNIRGKEDPYLKIGEVNDRAHKGESDYIWALKDINFEVQQGDVLGIIGKNGAGKSTLLKILSKVTAPTTGTIRAAGRIASLLEVGTGFHPEMTGRENIFMNGAIMGMTKSEIIRKLDEIVDFSGVERYLDTPVKRYSSGMTVRLGFAIAAHLEPEILVVDEVLAVGDAEFQKKAIGKMQDVSKGEGRTVLFVSHNMGAVKSLCNRGMVLEKGMTVFTGDIASAIHFYSDISMDSFKNEAKHQLLNGKARVNNYNFYLDGKIIMHGSTFPMGRNLELSVEIIAIEDVKDLSISIDIKNIQEELISHITNEDDNYFVAVLRKGESRIIRIVTDPIFYSPGLYIFDLWLGTSHIDGCYAVKNAFNIFVEQSEIIKRTRALPNHMKYFLNSKWK